MGLLFHRIHIVGSCTKCGKEIFHFTTLSNIMSGDLCETCDEFIKRPCSKCKGPVSRDILSKLNEWEFYQFFLTGIRLPVESIYTRVLIFGPSLVILAICILFFLVWIFDVTTYAFQIAIEKWYFDGAYNLFGSSWLAYIILFFTIYYLIQAVRILRLTNKKRAI